MRRLSRLGAILTFALLATLPPPAVEACHTYDHVVMLEHMGMAVPPAIKEALGERAYASLRDIPERVDVVQIFRRPEDVPAVVDEAIAIGAKAVWMQPGAEHEGAAEKARRAGLLAVVGACMMVSHRRLRG